jgi:predicted acyl esterase
MIRKDAVLVATVALLGPAAVSSTAAAAAPTARGSVEQVQVTGARPGAKVALLDGAGRPVASRRAGPLGGAVFRDVRPGSGYRVRQDAASSGALTVLPNRSAPPSTGVYGQRLRPGYGYLTTRDGTKLAVNVQLPGPPEQGPYPTFVEYSGYGYANPNGAESSISGIATLLGYAVVDVNMRGTGCSGGAFDYFEPLQGLDGYDVVETVARQPWAMHRKVGMLGVSYGGISQLFVAATAPPSLAAIAPLSVIDDSKTTLYPGGLLNTGFALMWAKQRAHDARPASVSGGQPWALQRIRGGDRTCKANQALHTEAVDLLAKVRANQFYVPKVADPVAPSTFVHRIKSPVFLACQWTDEQTGGHCPDLAHRFTGTRRKWFTYTNGTHIDSLDPATLVRWYDFLELYVARRAPRLPAAANTVAPTVYKRLMGVDGVTLPEDPIQRQPGYGAALAAFERLPQVRILFDSGAGGSTPGSPVPAFEQSFPRFPVPGTKARSWYMAPGGALDDARPAQAGTDVFAWSRTARPPTSFDGDTGSGAGGLWTAKPGYRWTQDPPGTALSYVTAPLPGNVAIVGPGAVQAWIRSSAPRLDLQVTVSEVRPDGKETFVQNGWLRTSGRKLDPRRSTLLSPVPTLRRADDRPLPAGRFAEVTVPLYYQGHVYRAGSRIRIVIAAPRGDQPVWAFDEMRPRGRAKVSLAHSRAMPSRVILPEVPGVSVPTGLPPCPGLRGQPCRSYRPR